MDEDLLQKKIAAGKPQNDCRFSCLGRRLLRGYRINGWAALSMPLRFYRGARKHNHKESI